MKESPIQLAIMHELNRNNFWTMKLYLERLKIGATIPSDIRGLYGRVNTMAVPITRGGRIIGYRKNPYLLVGAPDIQGFAVLKDHNGYTLDAKSMKCPNTLIYKTRPFAIECKIPAKGLNPAQKVWKQWFELSGGLYIIGKQVEDIKPLLI